MAHQHLVPLDATFEFRRAKASLGNKADGMDWLNFLERKGAMDEVYKAMLSSILTVDVVEPRERPDQPDDRGKARIGVEWLRFLEGKGTMDEFYTTMLSSLLTMDERPCPREVKIGTDDVVEPRKRPMAPRNGKRKYSFTDQQDDHGKARISEDNKARVSLGNCHCHQKAVKEESHSGHVAQARSVKIGMVKEEYEANKKTEVKKENEKTYPGRGSRKNSGARSDRQDVGQVRLREKHVVRGQTESMKVVRGDNGCSSKKAAFANCAVKKERDHCVETRLPMEGINSQIRNVKRAKCSFADNSDEKYLGGEGSCKSGPEVIILDSDKVVKKEIVSSFVCSKKYYSCMADEGCPSAIDGEFRRELLKVLKKPYDRDEYQKSREAIRAGSYLDHHPGQLKNPKGLINVQRKLTKYRYKRGKCLIIVRGFLFWLQNLTREGAFVPWKDKQCLKLKLPSR